MPRLLIYDSEVTGHHSDYLGAVFSYAEAHAHTLIDWRLIFMVPAAMQEMLGAPARSSPVEFLCLGDEQLAQISKTGKRERSYQELGLIGKAVKEHAIDRLFLMNLDYFQVALASRQGRKIGCEVSGILFQPYTRFEKVAREPRFLPGEYMRALRKRFRLTALLRNPHIQRLCVPCDQAAVDLLVARHGRRVRVDMLPEPYFAGEASPSVSMDIRKNYNIDADDRVILVFGHIIARKNVPNLLGALLSSSLSYAGGITLLVVGNASDAYRARLEKEIARFRQAGAQSRQVVLDCSFADTATMEAVFAQSDIVAMPYFKAYQSSGILFLAARHRKPVITANVGLMKELVEQYNLGKTADPQEADSIAEALNSLLQSPPQLDTSNGFFVQHTPEKHAACILGL